jgi:hypothetical protein
MLGGVCILILSFAFPAWLLLKDVNPWGFFVMLPAVFGFFQLLWLILNPFAMIFKDKVEIKQSFIHQKARYFVDIKKVQVNKGGDLMIVYNDEEVEKLSLFGIRKKDTEPLKEEIEKNISASLKTRV